MTKKETVYMAEEKLLGGLIKREKLILGVIDKLNPSLFSNKDYALIYQAIIELYKEDIALDDVTVLNRVSSYGHHINPELMKRIYSKGYGMVTDDQIKEYYNIIRTSAFKRKAIKTCADFLEEARNISSPEEIADKFMNIGIELSDKLSATNRTDKISVDTNAILDNIDFMLENPDHIIGIPTGFPTIDKHFHGLRNGYIWTIGGESSGGKTYFIMQMILNIAKHLLETGSNKNLLLISLEMTKEQLNERLIGMVSGINPEHIINPHEYFIYNKIPKNEDTIAEFKKKVKEATALINKLPIILDDSSELSADEIVAISKKVQLKDGLACVFVDYVGLIGNGEGAAWEDITTTYQKFKYLAKSTGAPLVLLNQYKNSDEKLNARNKFRPDYYLLTGGKEPRNASHVILHILNYAIHKDFGEANPELKDKIFVLNDKNRSGTKQMSDLEIEFHNGQIVEVDKEKNCRSVADLVFNGEK